MQEKVDVIRLNLNTEHSLSLDDKIATLRIENNFVDNKIDLLKSEIALRSDLESLQMESTWKKITLFESNGEEFHEMKKKPSLLKHEHHDMSRLNENISSLETDQESEKLS